MVNTIDCDFVCVQLAFVVIQWNFDSKERKEISTENKISLWNWISWLISPLRVAVNRCLLKFFHFIVTGGTGYNLPEFKMILRLAFVFNVHMSLWFCAFMKWSNIKRISTYTWQLEMIYFIFFLMANKGVNKGYPYYMYTVYG